MKQLKLRWIAISFILIATLEGCYDFSKFENMAVDDVSPKMVVPVINSKITFKELAERNDANTIVIQKPNDTKFYLAFRDTIEVGNAASLFTIPAVTYSKNFQLDNAEIPLVPVPNQGTFGPITKEYTEQFNPITGAELNKIKLTQGTLNYRIVNYLTQGIGEGYSVEGKITIPSIKTINGNSLEIFIPEIMPGGSTQAPSIDLTNHTLDLHSVANSTYNTFSFSATLTLKSYNGGVITASNYVSIEISLNNLDFSYLTAKLNKIIGLPDHDYKVDIFRSSYLADQHFEEPKLTFQFINGYGVPFGFNINNMEVTNTTSNEIVFLTNDPNPPANSLLIGSPNSINFVGQLGNPPVRDTLELTKANSNIENIFDIAPNQFKLRSNLILGGATSDYDDFISKDANLSIISEIELPLLGWVETNEIRDTIVDIELPDLEEDLNLKESDSLKITIKFKFDNLIPLNAYFQAYFINDLNQELTKLFNNEEWLIRSAVINPTTGKATTSTVNYSEIVVNRSKYSLMKDATKVVLQVRFKTGGNANQNVVIETTNSIQVQMSVTAEATVNID